MSAKFIHTLSDENPDLRKQIGCMNGIFQLFERHHFLSSRRQITGKNHKRLPSVQHGNHNTQTKNATEQAREKTHKKGVKEKQRISTESSRTSFSSSSCSSSLSSLECNNKASQQEPCLFNQTTVTETHGRDSPVYQLNASFRSSQHSPDLRDVVKDSIYREARGLSVKTATKGESGGQTLKYFDSPRPVQQPKPLNPKVSGPKESFQILHKLQQAPQKSSEGRRGLLPSGLKDARRFSCDGRESRDTSKSTIKLKELPRLSLDSRAGTIRSSTAEMKSNYLLGDVERRDGNSNNFLNQQEEPESRTRLSNVVAKLMGLEALPDSMSLDQNQTRHIKTHPGIENQCIPGSPKTIEKNKQNTIPGSPKRNQKEISTRSKSADPVKKPMPNSKFPLEPAPWRQPDGSKSSQTPALKSQVTQPKASNPSLSVYGEIEKRLAQLEFKQSGKDLRALKQILEAMQKTKEILETKNEVPKPGTQTSSNSSLRNNSKSSNLCSDQSDSHISALTRTSSPYSFKSPIVIMRPAKFMQKASNPASSLVSPRESSTVLHGLLTADSAESSKESKDNQTATDLIPRAYLRDRSSIPSHPMDKSTAARFARLPQASKDPQSRSRESTNSGRSSGTLNLRQPPKNSWSEKQTRPTTPSESTRTRKQSTRQPTQPGSPHRKPRSRSFNLQPSDDELSDVGSEVRDMGHHGDAMSLQSESSISLASQVDEEVSSTDRSYKITRQKQKKPAARSMKDGSVAELAVASEQPSPVSVLDATFYSEELPSPIKKKSIAFKEDEIEWNQVDVNRLSSRIHSSFNSAINDKKVENIHLLMKLTQKLSAHEQPFVCEITGFYNSTNSRNPDHQYILEILLASGLAKDFESGFTTNHLNQTGYPINPTLFLALEHTKAGTMFSNDKKSRANISKLHRKLVFDVVNEILIHKLLLESSSKRGVSQNMLADQRPREQQLWEELCSEVDRLQGNSTNCSLDDEEDSLTSILRADLKHQSKNWTTCSSELPWLVLDLERLIFKDLISEIVTGEALGLQMQSAGRCRKLNSK